MAQLQAVLVCGGVGARLRPWSYVIPKPMFPIGERPILELLLNRLRRQGIVDIHLAVGYKAEVIEAYFGDGSSRGLNLQYIREQSPLGTAGALAIVRDLVQGPVLVMNGDLMTRLDFLAMAAAHQERAAAITIGTRAYDVPVPYGVVDTDHGDADTAGRVVALREKPSFHVRINAGIYMMDRTALDLVPAGRAFDAPDLVSAAVARGLPVWTYPISEPWMDIGRLEDYDRAVADASQWLDDDAHGP